MWQGFQRLKLHSILSKEVVIDSENDLRGFAL